MERVSFVSSNQAAQLLKRLRNLAGDRAQELTLLRDEFADPEDLAKCYVEPHLQERSPETGRQDIFGRLAPRQPAFALLNQFLASGPPPNRDCSHQLFLLAEAGMGKTALLLLLKLIFLTENWPAGCRCELLRLGRETLMQLASVQCKPDTILLLDGLSEDPTARNRLQKRLLDLLKAGTAFRRVIITCRTHFFPDVQSDRSGRQLIQGLEGYNCPVLHLSPFTRQQAQELVRRRLGADTGYFTFRSRRRTQTALLLLEQSPLLRQTPLLLRHIGQLLDADAGQLRDMRSLYTALFRSWLQQCCAVLRKQRPDALLPPDEDDLFKSCVKIACWLEQEDKEKITAQNMRKLLNGKEQLCWTDHDALLRHSADGTLRFSHGSFREFTLACALTDREPLSFPVRATELLIHFLELAGGIAQHRSSLDASNFKPHRYAKRYDIRFFWQDQFRRKDGSSYVGPELVMLPGGRFRMGDIQGRGSDNAWPAHDVELDTFGIGRFPVTFAEYDPFCMATGRARPRDEGWGRARRPVINVSWQDAADYCAWLARQTGRHYRLPTEAEWEYACRAGSETDYCFGEDAAQLDCCAWHLSNADRQTQPTGGKQANAWGIHDMHGNVWEWCADWYAKNSYTREPVRNPLGTGAEQGAGRVLRGGSWDSSAKFVSSWFRFCLSPGLRIIRAGFRVALGE